MKIHYGRLTDAQGFEHEVVAENTGDIVCISGVKTADHNPDHFESDFRHVESWAAEMGYEWEQHEFDVTLEELKRYFGQTPPAPSSPAFGRWTSVDRFLPEIVKDRYERNYVRVLVTMDNQNVREMAFVKIRGESEGRWQEIAGGPVRGRVTHWMGMPPAAAEQGGPS